jgi:hypothetical protein
MRDIIVSREFLMLLAPLLVPALIGASIFGVAGYFMLECVDRGWAGFWLGFFLAPIGLVIAWVMRDNEFRERDERARRHHPLDAAVANLRSPAGRSPPQDALRASATPTSASSIDDLERISAPRESRPESLGYRRPYEGSGDRPLWIAAGLLGIGLVGVVAWRSGWRFSHSGSDALPALFQSVGGDGWSEQTTQNEMDGSRVITLSLPARNEIKVVIAEIAMRPTLVIRCRGRRTEVYIHTTLPSRFELDDFRIVAPVRLRLDDARAHSATWTQSANLEALFAPNPIALAKQLLRANALHFEFSPFGGTRTPTQVDANGRVIAEFDLRGLADHVGKLASACGWRQ